MRRSYFYSQIVNFFAVLLAGIFLYSGCEPAFSPIKEDGRDYSIFGFLNASADTQFVRIEQLRDNLFSDAPSDLKIKAKLTNTSTGQSVMMKDSLFHYYSDGKAHNYYTTFSIDPAETYRLEIIKEETKASTEVTVPDDFPSPELIAEDELRITGIDRLIGVKMIYSVIAKCTNPPNRKICPEEPTINQYGFQHLSDTLHVENGTILASIKQGEDLKQIQTQYSKQGFIVDKIEVMVAAGSPSWPDFLSLDEETAAVPGTASNIEGGVGLLGGVVTDTILVFKDGSYNF